MVPQILIVEDDVEEALMLENIFKDNNYNKISCFNNAFSFVDYLNHNQESLPKVVILDYSMPKISGFQLLAFLKHNEKFSGIKVIMYSGFDSDDYKIKCIKAGAVDYVKKLSSHLELEQFALKVKTLAETGSYK